MEFLTREDDGTFTIREYVGKATLTKNAMSSAAQVTEKKKKDDEDKLIVQIAGIHEGVTRNYTEYPWEELKASMDSWTNPYNRPLIVNHDDYNVDTTIGRIQGVSETNHNGLNALLFTASVTDAVAMEKIADGRYFTVSIGAKVRSAECSICGADKVKWEMCDHKRGKYYLQDEDDESSEKVQCTWLIGGIEGLELSYVSVPADPNAMTLSASMKEELKAEDVDVESLNDLCMKLYVLSSEGGVDAVSESGAVKHIADLSEMGKLYGKITESSSNLGEEAVTESVEEVEEESTVSETENVETHDSEEEVAEETEETEEVTEETEDADTEESEQATETEEAEEEAETETETSEEDEEVTDEADTTDSEEEEADDSADADESEETEEEETTSEETEETEETAEEEAETETEEDTTQADAEENFRSMYEGMTDERNSLREELRETRIQLLLALRGTVDFSSEEAATAIESYRTLEDSVLIDLVRGEIAQRRADLASVANSVSNPTLTVDDGDEEPHNPSEKLKTRKYKVKGVNKEIEVTGAASPLRKFKLRK